MNEGKIGFFQWRHFLLRIDFSMNIWCLRLWLAWIGKQWTENQVVLSISGFRTGYFYIWVKRWPSSRPRNLWIGTFTFWFGKLSFDRICVCWTRLRLQVDLKLETKKSYSLSLVLSLSLTHTSTHTHALIQALYLSQPLTHCCEHASFKKRIYFIPEFRYFRL